MAVESDGRIPQVVVGFCGDGLLERGVSAKTKDADTDMMASEKLAVDRELTVEEEIRQKLDSREILKWANLTNKRVTGNIGNPLSYKLCADSRRTVAIQRGKVLDTRKGFFYTMVNERLAVAAQ
jgi:Cu2+-containing amine oxidase